MPGMYQAILLALITTLATSAIDVTTDVTISLTAPPDAVSVERSLVSLSIEQDRWLGWTGTTEINKFFYNALDNVVRITNSPPLIRIGANSEDHTNFGYHVKYEQSSFPASTRVTPYPEATNITVGQGFYDVISNLPSGTSVHWGVNLREYNLTAAYLETKALMQAFGSPAVQEKGITLKFIEIGNEADLYHTNGGRKKGWNVSKYVSQWVEIATNVSVTAGLSKTSFTKLIGAAFADSSHDNLKGFSPQAIFAEGILDTLPGALITTISQHHYSGSFCTGSDGVLQDLMTKSYIRGNISVFKPDISATFAHGLEYVLGETNSVSCHGAPGVSNTAGAALWALDYSLYAVLSGISRLHFHHGIGYKYNFFQPVTLNRSILDGSPITPLSPHIQPSYYAAMITAEAIGSTGHTKVVEVSINAPDISGYAMYDDGDLVRVVFINLFAYLPGASARSTTHINIRFSGSGTTIQRMEVKRLNITYANATSGITWGGQTYETPDARVSGTPHVEILDVDAGLNIQATEAVLLRFR